MSSNRYSEDDDRCDYKHSGGRHLGPLYPHRSDELGYLDRSGPHSEAREEECEHELVPRYGKNEYPRGDDTWSYDGENDLSQDYV